jgi:acetyl esterase/lipase
MHSVGSHAVRWLGCLTVVVATVFQPRDAAAQQSYLRPRDVDSLPSRPADARRAYGPDSVEFGELRLPPGRGPFPVAVVIHGGCWLARWSLRNSAALADALRDEGIATWNLEYRRVDHPGGGWPGTFADVALGTDYLRTLAKEFPLDLNRVIGIGHSAGAQLVLWTAGRHRLNPQGPFRGANPLRLKAAIALGGPGDVEEFIGRDSKICGGPVISQLFGGLPSEVPERYAIGSPHRLLPLGTLEVLIAGDHDPVMPGPSLDAYAALARRSGDSVEVIVAPNASHFEVVAPTTMTWPLVRDAVRRALAMPPR